MLDKLHLLERLEIIESADIWQELRQARNHVEHEYPDHPELTAAYLNTIIHLAPVLLKILDTLKTKIP